MFSGDIKSTATISGGKISGAEIEVYTKLYNNDADFRVNISSSNGIELKPKHIIFGSNPNFDSIITLNPSYGIGFGEVGHHLDASSPKNIFYDSDVNSFPIVFLNRKGLFLNTSHLTGEDLWYGALRSYAEFAENLKHIGVYKKDSSEGKEVYITSDGTFGTCSSSRKFKNSISTDLTHVADPHGLYNIDVVQFKYNKEYLSLSNSKKDTEKVYIGFIAEDVEKHFKNGTTYDEQGQPDGWSLRQMFPAALKLIQEQHEEIISLTEEIESMKRQFQELKSCIIN